MSHPEKFNLGIIQHASTENKSENIKLASELIDHAYGQSADVICLQELFSTPYFCTVENADLFDLAEPLEGETISHMRKLAEELSIVLVVPFFEKRAPGVYHNSAAVIDADGSIAGVYRKMHIPDDPLFYEKFYFTPGDAPGFKVINTKFVKLGVLICWDQWFPEAARITSLMGAELLCYPTAIGWHPAEKEEFGVEQMEAWSCIQRSHAIANGVYVASVNRIGHEKTPGTDGLEFFGSSFISDPFGVVLEEGLTDEQAVLVTEIDKSKIDKTRRNWPFLRDRRIDDYTTLLKRLND